MNIVHPRSEFRPLKLKYRSNVTLKREEENGIRKDFCTLLINAQKNMQEKIHAYDSDAQQRSQQHQRQLQAKAIQQKEVLLKFDAAAKQERLWQHAVEKIDQHFLRTPITTTSTTTPPLPTEVVQLIKDYFTSHRIESQSIDLIMKDFQEKIIKTNIPILSLNQLMVIFEEHHFPFFHGIKKVVEEGRIIYEKLSQALLESDRYLTKSSSSSSSSLLTDRQRRLQEITTLVNTLSQSISSSSSYHQYMLEEVKKSEIVIEKLTQEGDRLSDELAQAERSTKILQEVIEVRHGIFPFLSTMQQHAKQSVTFFLQQEESVNKTKDTSVVVLTHEQSEKWNEIQASLKNPLQLIPALSTSSTTMMSSSNGDNGSGNGSNSLDPSKQRIALKYVISLIHSLYDFIQEVGVENNSLTWVMLSLVNTIFQEAQKQANEYYSQFYAMIVSGLGMILSEGKRKYLQRLIEGKIAKSCLDWIIPNFTAILPSSSSSSAVSDDLSVDEKMAIFRFFASYLSYSSNRDLCLELESSSSSSSGEILLQSSMTELIGQNLTIAWNWILHTSHQLAYLVYVMEKKESLGGMVTPALLCFLLHTFLRFTGHLLALYYQDKFFTLLKTIMDLVKVILHHHGVNSRIERFRDYLDKVIIDEKIHDYYYNHQPPYVIMTLLIAYKAEGLKTEVEGLEQDKTSPFMQRIKSYQMDRLRVIFNRLSITKESQSNAINQLLEKIMIAHSDSKEMMKYMLYKVVSNVLRDCQEEFFNEMDEGQPLRLARLVVGLCQEMESLGEYFVNHFYHACPLLIPYVLPEGLGSSEGDVYLHSLGFIKKAGSTSWESNDAWLARMSKIIAVFAVIAIQPEQRPFTIAHIYRYLTRLINAFSTMTTSQFFTATCLEVVLRIAGRDLHMKYGGVLLKMLEVIQRDILPKLDEKMAKKKSLETFVQRFLTSNGQDFMSLFHKQEC